MTRAVLFDLDDTLFDHAGCARRALQAVQGREPALAAMTFDTLERTHAEFLEQLHTDVMRGRVPLAAARRERFRRLLAASGAAAPDDLGDIHPGRGEVAVHPDVDDPDSDARS